MIHQILHSWIGTLEIDGETGESIVTIEDLNRLNDTLEGLSQGFIIRQIGNYVNHYLRIVRSKFSYGRS